MQDIDVTTVLADGEPEQSPAVDPCGRKMFVPFQGSSEDDPSRLLEELPNLDRCYSQGERFAEGGFGIISRAHDRFLDRIVAVKTLRPELCKNQDAILKFLREAKLSARLDHPSIVPLYGLDGDRQNGLHLVMKYVNGITMREYLERIRKNWEDRRVSAAEAQKHLKVRLEYFLKLCDVIEYVHARDVVHCDLKPENIMVGRHGEIYVMDWGSAVPSGTARGRKVDGSPAYVAPEIFQNGATTPAVDVFALGMILFAMVTLRSGVSGNSAKEVLGNIRAGRFEPVRHFYPHLKISPALAAVIERARCPDPAGRYGSVQELADDIRHFLFKEEVSAYPDNQLQRLARYMYRHRLQSLAVIATMLFLSAGTVAWSLYRENRSIEETNQRILQRLILQQQTESDAYKISDLLLAIQSQLKAFCAGMSIEYGREDQSYTPDRVFFNHEYLEPKSAPADLTFSPVYNRPISMTHSACHTSTEMSRWRATKMFRNLPMQEHGGLGLLLRGFTDNDGTERSLQKNMESFIEHGGAIRRLSVLLNNGIGFRYPGMYEDIHPSQFQDERIRELRRVNSRFYYWGLPHLDSSGHMVFSCWGPLIDADGNEQGSVGVDVCFHEVISHLYKGNDDRSAGSTYYLVNRRDEVIFSSDYIQFSHHKNFTPEEAKAIPPIKKFPIPDMLKQIRNSSVRQGEYEENGSSYIVSWSPIAATQWLLIQITDVARMPLPAIHAAARHQSRTALSPF